MVPKRATLPLMVRFPTDIEQKTVSKLKISIVQIEIVDGTSIHSPMQVKVSNIDGNFFEIFYIFLNF